MGLIAFTYVPYNGSFIPLVLPTTEMHIVNDITDKQKIFSVTDILRDNYEEDFMKLMSVYVWKEAETLDRIEGFEDAATYSVKKVYVKNVETAIGQPVEKTVVDIILTAYITASCVVAIYDEKEGVKAANREKNKNIDFRVRYIFDLRKEYKRVSGPIVCPYEKLEKDILNSSNVIRSNKYLLPVIYNEEYEDIAGRFLKQYYGEALLNPMAVSGYMLAKRMGISV